MAARMIAAAQTTRRVPRAIQANKSTIHCSQARRLDSADCLERFHRRVLIVLSVAIFGSALTASSAREMSCCAGPSPPPDAAGGRLVAAVPGAATISASTIAPAHRLIVSLRERTSELLLDVPRLELGTAIQIHRETGRHIKRFEIRHGKPVRDRQREGQNTR